MACFRLLCLVLFINIQGRLSLPNERSWHWVKVYDDEPEAKLQVREDPGGSGWGPPPAPTGKPCPDIFHPYASADKKKCCNDIKDKTCADCPAAECQNYGKYDDKQLTLLNFGTEEWRHTIIPKDIVKCVNNMNMYRRRHVDTPDIVWDEDLARQAADWAQHLAAWRKRDPSKYHDKHAEGKFLGKVQGENLIRSSGPYNGHKEHYLTCENANGAWYKEVKDYDWAHPGFTYDIGHFSAMVWKGVKRFGIGIARNEHGQWFTDNGKRFTDTIIVARFSPAPNMQGRFKENVMPLKPNVKPLPNNL